MRDPETDRLLTDVREAVAAAREGGVTVRACIFDATWSAVDSTATGWPSEDARNRASDAYRQAVQRIESSGPKAGHDAGPSVQECAEADRAHWADKYAEGN